MSFNSNYDVHFTLALLGVLLVWHHKVTGSITGIVENTLTVFQHCCLKKRRVESKNEMESAVFVLDLSNVLFPSPRVSMTHIDDFLAHVSEK